MTDKVIAITGGIGSGKSVVSRILTIMGYEVYDCDTMAKQLMDTSAQIKRCLIEAFGSEVLYDDYTINRPYLSEIVFNDAQALAVLNSIVHHEVRKDLASKIKQIDHHRFSNSRHHYFFETAILAESGLDAMADRIWLVTAPEELRIKRIMGRSALTHQQAKARIDCQRPWNHDSSDTDIIVNDGLHAVLPRVMELINSLTRE